MIRKFRMRINSYGECGEQLRRAGGKDNCKPHTLELPRLQQPGSHKEGKLLDTVKCWRGSSMESATWERSPRMSQGEAPAASKVLDPGLCSHLCLQAVRAQVVFVEATEELFVPLVPPVGLQALILPPVLFFPILWGSSALGPHLDHKPQPLPPPSLPKMCILNTRLIFIKYDVDHNTLDKKTWMSSYCLLKKVKLPNPGIQYPPQSGLNLPVQFNCLPGIHTLIHALAMWALPQPQIC